MPYWAALRAKSSGSGATGSGCGSPGTTGMPISRKKPSRPTPEGPWVPRGRERDEELGRLGSDEEGVRNARGPEDEVAGPRLEAFVAHTGKASDAAVDVSQVDVYELRDGKIVLATSPPPTRPPPSKP